MTQSKTPYHCYLEIKEILEAITPDRFIPLKMPHEESMQEGRRVEALVERYGDQLRMSDINPDLLDSFGVRTGTFSYAVAAMDSHVKVAFSNKEIYRTLKKEGYDLRRNAISDFQYVFRSMPAELETLDTINEGKSDLDMIKDLLALSLLAKEYRKRLDDAHVSSVMIDRLDTLYKELFSITAQLDIDPKKVEQSKLLCNQAWTYMYDAQSEIYQAGRFVFRDQPEIKELFYIDYFQKAARIRNTETVQPFQPEKNLVLHR